MPSVSCSGASFCVAFDHHGRAVTYNGTNWSSPSVIDGSNQLNSVSCPNSTFCVAVDALGNELSFGGTSWRTRLVDSGKSLNSVSCPSSGFCAVVDSSGSVLFGTQSSNSWTNPQSVDAGHGGLNSVSCAGSGFCAAVDSNGAALTYNALLLTTSRRIVGTNFTNLVLFANL